MEKISIVIYSFTVVVLLYYQQWLAAAGWVGAIFAAISALGKEKVIESQRRLIDYLFETYNDPK